MHEQQKQTKKEQKKLAREKKSKPVMEFMKTVTRKDPFWKVLVAECSSHLSDFSTSPARTPDEEYETLKRKLSEAVTSTLEKCKPNRKLLKARLKSTPEITELRIQKNRLYREAKTEKEAARRVEIKVKAKKVNTKLKKRIRNEINSYKREQVKEIEDLEVDDCRRLWKELKALSGWTSKDSISDTVMNEAKEEVSGEGVFEVWKESYRKLGIEDEKDPTFDVEFGKKVTAEQETIYGQSFNDDNICAELDRPINVQEVSDAIKRLKAGKASGNDEIVAEILKKGGDQVTYAVFLLCEKAWGEEKLPKDWRNYRGITLLSIVGKVYAQVINERLVRWSESNKILVEEQGGFRPQRGCPDQIFSLVEILQNRGKKGTFCCFIDVKKAFDRVFRAGLWKRLAEEGVRGKLWRVLKSIYETVESCVVIDGRLSDWFPIDTGVRQGCVLSPLLRSLLMAL